jgi:type I restriction-modification system DNA methylase subunit/restriction endonuclease S subunit
MITKENLPKVLECLGFEKQGDIYSKHYDILNCDIIIDFTIEKIQYPSHLDTGANTTTNFSQGENFVVLECVNRLLEQGYKPENIFLEKAWTLGHTGKGGRADITVYDNSGNAYLIIECKRAGNYYKEARKELFEDPAGKQLFSYWAQARSTQWLQLYASDFDEENNVVTYKEEIVRSIDDKNVELLAKEEDSILLYKNASAAEDFFIVWDETYSKKVYHNIIFGEDSVAYKIGDQPIKNKDLKKFKKEDGITDSFREILRHNNISDKENAFNKLLSLFICKFVDEERHRGENDIMDFQYIDGTDNYYTLYERLLALFQIGMKEYLKEEVFYLDNDYIRKTLDQFTGKKRKALEEELVDKFQKTKMLSCQVFAFREVYNEKLFLQNGKVLVEVVELFQNYKLAYSSKDQFLGELFENLLDQGFKQEAGQFFTPVPITRFVWNSLPLDRYLSSKTLTLPKVIDFACGSGHFLTEGVSAISESIKEIEDKNISEAFYGIDKDNRLARVSKVAMLLNGAANAHIKQDDGLEHDEDFLGERNSFDILVANPPYSVDAFKTHESRKVQSMYETIKLMSFNCGDIQNVFIERMHHLLKPKGIAAIVMPSALLSNVEASDIKTREILLHNFYIRCIASFGGKTFGKTSTNTIILFLEHFDFPPQKAKLLRDSATAIVNGENLEDWTDSVLFNEYLKAIDTTKEVYLQFVSKSESLFENTFAPYFKEYETTFRNQTNTKKILGKISETERKEKENQPLKKNERSSEEQKQLLSNEFFDWVKEVEENKLLIFALTYQQQTLIITAPTDTNEQKRFLGYTSSERRGSEGLIETDGLLTNISDRNDKQKLAWSVRRAFDGEHCLNDELEKYVKCVQTSGMMDFSKPSFDLQIKLSVDKRNEIVSKYPLVKLGDIAHVSAGNSAPQDDESFVNGKYPFFRMSDVAKEHLNSNLTNSTDCLNEKGISGLRLFKKGTILFPKSGASTYLDHRAIMGVDGYVVSHLATIFANTEIVLIKYLYEFLTTIKARDIKPGSGYPSLNVSDIENIKTPLPPLDIQQQIVSQCEKVDDEYNRNCASVEENKRKISEVISKVKGKKKKLREIAPYSTKRIAYSDTKANNYITTDNLLPNCEGMRTYDGIPNVESIISYQKGDILVSNIRPYLKKIWLADRDGGCSPDVLVFRTIDNIDSRFVYYSMRQDKFFDFMMQGTKGMKMPRGDKNSIPDFEIIIPQDQQTIISEIGIYEQKIAEAKAVMAGCAERKKQILEKWLK